MGRVGLAMLIVFLGMASSRLGWRRALGLCFILSAAGAGSVLHQQGFVGTHYGITGGSVAVTSTVVLLLLAGIVIQARNESPMNLVLLGLFVPIGAFLLVFYWGNESQQQAGLALYSAALLAFAIGTWLTKNSTPNYEALLSVGLTAVLAAHCFAALLQSRGSLIGMDPEARNWVLNEHRMVGFYNHPSVLGKTTFLLLFLLLPLTTSTSRWARGAAQAGIVLGLIASFLTVSRANVTASVCAILIWIVINRNAFSARARTATVVAVGGAIVANLGAIAALELRNQADPSGGPRSKLLETGLSQIADTPWTGVGANFYSEYVGRYDVYAASGFPVHNSFLLGTAELGAPLAALFFSPIVIAYAAAWRRWHETKMLDAQTAALIATTPGLALITFTGWGMVAESSLLLWYAALGTLAIRGTAPITCAKPEADPREDPDPYQTDRSHTYATRRRARL